MTVLSYNAFTNREDLNDKVSKLSSNHVVLIISTYYLIFRYKKFENPKFNTSLCT